MNTIWYKSYLLYHLGLHYLLNSISTTMARNNNHWSFFPYHSIPTLKNLMLLTDYQIAITALLIQEILIQICCLRSSSSHLYYYLNSKILVKIRCCWTNYHCLLSQIIYKMLIKINCCWSSLPYYTATVLISSTESPTLQEYLK